MRFKSQEQQPIEEINLVPMMDVLMSILTFFILLSMILTGALEGVDVKLPSEQQSAQQGSTAPPPLIVKIGDNNELLLEDKPIERDQLGATIEAHLSQNPQNSAVLVAAPKANYEQVVQLLAQMRKVGGERVSLGIEAQ